jgi:probable HAF family extracellular repeat protein
LDYPASTETQALGVNNLGDVVGFYMDATNKMHGFIYNLASAKYGTIDNTNGVGATLVNGINDKGTMVGFFEDQAGNTNGFMAAITGCM